MTCLGDELAALVDGELDHAARERAQAHLLHCEACRAEADSHRRLKARLGSLSGPAPSLELSARLLDLRVPGVEPVRSGPVRPVSVRPAARPTTPRAPARSTRLRRRAGVGGVLLGAALAGAFALGAPRSTPSTVPVDPAGTVFVSDFTGSGSGGPVVTTVGGPGR